MFMTVVLKPLPCTVRDKVFLNFNLEERSKVMAGVNTEFSEVIWFYPSANATENDKYVTFNYSEKIWYFGTLSEQRGWIAAHGPSLGYR